MNREGDGGRADRVLPSPVQPRVGGEPISSRHSRSGLPHADHRTAAASANRTVGCRREGEVTGRKILVPLDGSPGSEAALLRARDLAQAGRAVLRLLYVAPKAEPVVSPDGHIIAYADDESHRVARAMGEYLWQAAAALGGLEVEVAVRFGDPVGEILAETEAAGAEMIAMATHRRAGLGRLLKGSVAERVEREARVPVLLVTHGERPLSGETVGIRCERRAAPTAPATGVRRTVRRRFWCAWSQRDVEVEFEVRGLPGFRSMVAVQGCSAFDPPSAIECQRGCLAPAFRQPWHPQLPTYGDRSGPAE